ncbi:O-methyltransferase [Salipiger mucosus]|uniref:O-methyltransferase n=1 Tax=Salipiger mucosus DSM 16094 TaxID=1123237 RepID=S9QZD9_9RHOB|nr:class I SAM-dependent methyltransferase [Salipiger mucosus]EPX84972.1 hypothetical protein Salmuc_00569 [Salipiger mucosus DSM 16094]
MTKAEETAFRDRLHGSLADVDALMTRAVYDALFDAAAEEGATRILEIGTAHGAGTIAMALGAASRGHDTRISTVDTLQALPDIPSSRSEHGDVAQNEAIVRGNFRKAGVADRIDLHVGRSEAFAAAMPEDFRIDMLVMDADGRIDRDLLLFGERLVPGALVVVDDIDGKVGAAFRGGGLSIDLKHVISEKLTSRLVAEGYLTFERRVVDTSMFRAEAPQDWDPERIKAIAIECYRELVFLETRVGPVAVSTIDSLLRSTRLLRPVHSAARSAYRRVTGRNTEA